jgi:hypothetical protein
MRNPEDGFLLLDRAVVAALGVVLAVALVVFTRTADHRADAAACRQDAAQVSNAVDAYRALHTELPTQRMLVRAGMLSHESAMHTIAREPAGTGYHLVATGVCAKT